MLSFCKREGKADCPHRPELDRCSVSRGRSAAEGPVLELVRPAEGCSDEVKD